MKYTVNKLSKLSNVSVRSLHYYDEIHLLSPALKERNGYRYYGESELLRLQQILFYKELDFPLKEIQKILQDDNFTILKALDEHRKSIESEIRRLQNLLNTIDKTELKLQGKNEMNDNEYFKHLSKEEIANHKAEAYKEYGTFNDKTKHWPVEKFKALLREGDAITKSIAFCMNEGLSASDPKVQSEIAKHYLYINTFWDCSYEAYIHLGEMYVEDKRFKENIDVFGNGLAAFLRDAMKVYGNSRS